MRFLINCFKVSTLLWVISIQGLNTTNQAEARVKGSLEIKPPPVQKISPVFDFNKFLKSASQESELNFRRLKMAYFGGPKPLVLQKKLKEWKKQCREEVGHACRLAGWVTNLEGNPNQGLSLLKKGCQFGNYHSCAWAISESQGDLAITKWAMAKITLGCEDSDKKACLELARPIKKVEKEKEPFDYWLKACDLGAGQGCLAAGVYSYRRKEPAKAQSLFEKGCQLGDDSSCHALILTAREEGKEKIALALAKKSCNLNFAKSCLDLGKIELKAKNMEQASIHFQKACDLGEPGGCYRRGINYLKSGNFKIGLIYYTVACQYRVDEACKDWDFVDKVWKKFEQAIAELAVECHKQSVFLGRACYLLGLINYQFGHEEKAVAAMEVACEFNYKKSCSRLKKYRGLSSE